MKKTFILSFIVFVFIFYGLSMKNSKSFNNNPEQEVSKDFFESNFPLKKLSSPYFINDLSYNKVDNFLKHPFYNSHLLLTGIGIPFRPEGTSPPARVGHSCQSNPPTFVRLTGFSNSTFMPSFNL